MSENLNNNSEVKEESTEHHHHRHHSSRHHSRHSSHRHSSHHHSSHHSHRHHSSSHKKSKSRSSRKFGGIKAFISKLAHKLSPKKISSSKHLKKIATSTKNDKRHEYAKISKRAIFGVALITLFIYTFWYMGHSEEDSDLKNASYTPSENSQLKIQVMQLQQEKDELQKKIDRYIELYGELEEDTEDDDKENNDTPKKTQQ